jgi:hypothetical protein
MPTLTEIHRRVDAAEVILQQRRDAHAARVAREKAMKRDTTAAHRSEPCSAAEHS